MWGERRLEGERQGSDHTGRQDGALDGHVGAEGGSEFCQLPRHLQQSLPLRQSWGRSAGGEVREGQDVSSVGVTACNRDGADNP